jgi:glycosyltransferase involved in cell wall biosynthesis
MKAAIAVISDLSTDMRVRKLALLMAEEGLDVTVVGRASSAPLPESIPGITFERIKIPFRKGPAMYLIFNLCLFFRLLSGRFDICVASDLDTLLPCYLISRLFGKKLVYDSHEYFTGQFGLRERRFKHFVWKSAERKMVPGIRYMITVSESIAVLYRDEYGVDPVVVRNAAPSVEHLAPRERSELGAGNDELLVVLQGSGINGGRGAEELISAVPMTTGVKLVIIGSGDIIDSLRRLAISGEARERIIFLPRMQWEEMMRYTMCCDAGLSLDTDTCINQRCSLPNKLFDYIAAGLPVLVSPLPEVSALVNSFGCGIVLDEVSPEEIARKLQQLADDRSLLLRLRQGAEMAREEINWEKEKGREQELIRIVINSN